MIRRMVGEMAVMPNRLIAKKTDKVLTPVRPNVGIEVAYR